MPEIDATMHPSVPQLPLHVPAGTGDLSGLASPAGFGPSVPAAVIAAGG